MSKKYLIKKIYSDIVDEDEMLGIVKEYTLLVPQNPIYTYKNKKPSIQFEPNAPYKLEIEQLES